ncbi:hypothetical protein RHRU231_960189 [Rhodococcus ruber]|uniref:Uncharacterized protein n=1 Tax=Rhodococcus ruber TaxID=1830 RepID=A0A098BWR4_9NOCA|nr:hypothetical protein RHRU231_960189 [Rhodococcus ruber]
MTSSSGVIRFLPSGPGETRRVGARDPARAASLDEVPHVRRRLGQRHLLARGRSLVPGAVPRHPLGSLPQRQLLVAEGGVQVVEASFVVLDKSAGAGREVVDRLPVRGQGAPRRERADGAQRVDELAEGVAFGKREVEVAHVRGRGGEDVVAAEEDVVLLEVEAGVAGRVPGGEHRAQGAAGERDPLVGGELAVGVDVGLAGRAFPARPLEIGDDLLVRGAGAAPLLGLPLGVAVVGGHEGELAEVVLVHADPAARRLPDPAGQADVVGVEVRDDHSLDVRDGGTDGSETVLQRGPGCVVVPADVDEDQSARRLHRVHLGVADRQVADRHGDAEDAVADVAGVVHGSSRH